MMDSLSRKQCAVDTNLLRIQKISTALWQLANLDYWESCQEITVSNTLQILFIACKLYCAECSVLFGFLAKTRHSM